MTILLGSIRKMKIELQKIDLLHSLRSDEELQKLLQPLITIEDLIDIMRPISVEEFWEIIDTCWAREV
jgi:hypothetical protein